MRLINMYIYRYQTEIIMYMCFKLLNITNRSNGMYFSYKHSIELLESFFCIHKKILFSSK